MTSHIGVQLETSIKSRLPLQLLLRRNERSTNLENNHARQRNFCCRKRGIDKSNEKSYTGRGHLPVYKVVPVLAADFEQQRATSLYANPIASQWSSLAARLKEFATLRRRHRGHRQQLHIRKWLAKWRAEASIETGAAAGDEEQAEQCKQLLGKVASLQFAALDPANLEAHSDKARGRAKHLPAQEFQG